MDIQFLISKYGTEISLVLAAIILVTASVFSILIRYWNKRDTLMNHRGVIEMMPSLISSLGVFFTFVGIAIGLYYFNVADLTLSIPKLLTGLKTAFFTSLAGMTGSMLLSGQVNRYFDKKKNGISDSVEAAEIIASKLDALLIQNDSVKTYLGKIDGYLKGLDSLPEVFREMNEREASLLINSEYVLGRLGEQVQLLDRLYNLRSDINEIAQNNRESFHNITEELEGLLSTTAKVSQSAEIIKQDLTSTKDCQNDIDNKMDSLLISVGNIEEKGKDLLSETKQQNGRVGELMDHTESLVSGQDEISKHVASFGDKLHGEIVEIEDKMAETNKLLEDKFKEFSELLKKSNTEALVEVMKKVTEEFQKQMKELIGRLVKENFEQLNKSVEKLNKWQEDNKEMIQSLTSQYKQMAENFENTSTSLKNVDEDTKSLVSEGGKLRQIVDLLNKVIVEDEKFIKISSDLQKTADLTKSNYEQFDAATKVLNDWVKKQRNFVDGVMVLIQKLEELNKIRDYGEQFWEETKKGLNEAVGIIKGGTDTLNQQVTGLDKQFYARLSTTLTQLDSCIQAIIEKAESQPPIV